MNQSWASLPRPLPHEVGNEQTGTLSKDSGHSEVRNGMLPLLLPYVLAACQ